MIIKCEIVYYGRTALLQALLILPLKSMFFVNFAFVFVRLKTSFKFDCKGRNKKRSYQTFCYVGMLSGVRR
jgi:hypothetical protein